MWIDKPLNACCSWLLWLWRSFRKCRAGCVHQRQETLCLLTWPPWPCRDMPRLHQLPISTCISTHIYISTGYWLYGYMEFASAYLVSHGWGTCTVHSRRRGQLRAEIEHLRAQELTHFRFGHRGNPTLACELKCLVRIQIGFKVPFNVLITQITIDPLHYIIIST